MWSKHEKPPRPIWVAIANNGDALGFSEYFDAVRGGWPYARAVQYVPAIPAPRRKKGGRKR